MTASSISLDSLSSPSPSPSPPPQSHLPSPTTATTAGRAKGAPALPTVMNKSIPGHIQSQHVEQLQKSKNSTSTSAATPTAAPITTATTAQHSLDSDSELSELTEDEQDTADKKDSGIGAVRKKGDDEDYPDVGVNSVDSDLDDESGGASNAGAASTNNSSHTNTSSSSTSRRAGMQQSKSAPASTSLAGAGGGKRGGGRKKRSSLVPAPMWGWAEAKNNNTNSSTNAIHEEEEEEEEEQPKAMEQEEDEEDGANEGQYVEGGSIPPHNTNPSSVGKRTKTKGYVRHIPAEGDLHGPPNPSSDKGTNGDSVSSKTMATGSDAGNEEAKMKGARIRRPKSNGSIPATGTHSEDEAEAESEEEGEEEEEEKQHPVRGNAYRKSRPSTRKRNTFTEYERPKTYSRKAAKNIASEESDESDDEEEEDAPDDTSPVNQDDNDDENDNENEDEENGTPIVPANVIISPTLKATISPKAGHTVPRLIDHTGPPIDTVGSITAAAAASSIMAGSAVVDPPSPDSSRASSSSQSPRSRHNGGTKDGVKKGKGGEEDVDDPDVEIEASVGIRKDGQLTAAGMDVDVDMVDADIENENENEIDGEPSADADEPEPDQEQEPEQEQEQEQDQDQDQEAEDPSPEEDLEHELESDLQPAHRAEALDVLATIELKFALLRERVYVEKMEGLAWEEKLVNEGNHPELIHIQKELLKRRDKRLELAARKRSYELANVAKRRRVHEDATWSWWKLARDELQTEMIAETSRKRRRLERDRRSIERPQPIRRIPMPPTEVPPAPSLRKIVKSLPFPDDKHHRPHRRNGHTTSKNFAYPELSSLSPNEVHQDLEVFFANRRGFDMRGNPIIGFHGAQIGPGIPLAAAYATHPFVNPMIGHLAHVPPPSTGTMPPPSLHQQHQVPPSAGYGYANANPTPSGAGGRMHPGPGGGPVPQPMHVHVPYPVDDPITGNVMTGPGHVVPTPHYYGAQNGTGGYVDAAPLPPHPPPSHPASSGLYHTRRSPSPMNGMNGVSGKQHQQQQHGPWVQGPGVAPAPPPGGYQGRSKGGEWGMAEERERQRRNNEYAVGMTAEDDERERMTMKEREREREREKRDIEREREREMMRGDNREKEREYRERESMDMERDRERDRQYREREREHMQMMAAQHRQGPPGGPPPPPSVHHQHVQHHHIVGALHPRTPHHHHVVHHHHGQSVGTGNSGPASHSQPPSSSMPPAPNGPGQIHSPRMQREYEMRPPSRHSQYPTEVIHLASSTKHPGPPPSQWKGDEQNLPPPPPPPSSFQPDYRDVRTRHSRRSSPAPGFGPAPVQVGESDRPVPTPFVMASTQAMQATTASTPTSQNVVGSPRSRGSSSTRYPSNEGRVRSPEQRFVHGNPHTGRSAPPAMNVGGPPASSSASGSTIGHPMSPPRSRILHPPQSPSSHLQTSGQAPAAVERSMATTPKPTSVSASASPSVQRSPMRFGGRGSSMTPALHPLPQPSSAPAPPGSGSSTPIPVARSPVSLKTRPGSPLPSSTNLGGQMVNGNDIVGMTPPSLTGRATYSPTKGVTLSLPHAASLSAVSQSAGPSTPGAVSVGAVGASSRTASPLLTRSLGHGGPDGEREREREKDRERFIPAGSAPLSNAGAGVTGSPRLGPTAAPSTPVSSLPPHPPPSIMSLSQMIDGH